MGKLAAFLVIAAAPFFAAGATHAQSTSGTSVGAASSPSPDVTVRGPERLVCRLARRTGTRMRSSRVCRTVTQWDEARAGRTQDDELHEAAETLDVLGADDISTNDQRDPLETARSHDTTLGPR